MVEDGIQYCRQSLLRKILKSGIFDLGQLVTTHFLQFSWWEKPGLTQLALPDSSTLSIRKPAMCWVLMSDKPSLPRWLAQYLFKDFVGCVLRPLF